METQIIQTEYGVYVPKPYMPVAERMVATAPSLIERAIATLKNLHRQFAHRQTRREMIQHAKPAQ
jgi:hypothetical protein